MGKYIFQPRRGTRYVNENGATLLNEDGTPVKDDWSTYTAQEDHLDPLEGEIVLEYEVVNGTGKPMPRFKIGDGTNTFANCEYMSVDSFIVPKPIYVTLSADAWRQDSDDRYYQVVTVTNARITYNSKVDLQPDAQQLVIFHQKDLAFVAENNKGAVSVFCVGQVPQNDYIIQATVTEVVGDGSKIIGNTTATPNPQPDWNQTDPTKADYIKNKPDLSGGGGGSGGTTVISGPFITPQQFGAKGDGSTNDTAAIQEAFNSLTDGGTIYFPPGEYIVRHCQRDPDDQQDYIAVLVKEISNLTVIFDNAALIKHELADVDRYTLFRFSNINGLEISGGIIEADRDEHADVSIGYGSKGIHILNCNNVYIHNMEVRNIFGDCIGVQGTSGKGGSNNVLIENCTLHNCYRNGITIGGVQNGTVRNCHIYDVRGGDPEAGIDIESEYGYNNNDITIEGCHIHDCAQRSIIHSSNSSNVLVRDCVLSDGVSLTGLSYGANYENVKIEGTINVRNDIILKNCDITSLVAYGPEDEVVKYNTEHGTSHAENVSVKAYNTTFRGSTTSTSITSQSIRSTGSAYLYFKGCDFTHLNGAAYALFYAYNNTNNVTIIVEDSTLHLYNNSKDTFHRNSKPDSDPNYTSRFKDITLLGCKIIAESETMSQRILNIAQQEFSLINCIIDMSKVTNYGQQSVVAMFGDITANCHGNSFISAPSISLCSNVFGATNVTGTAYITNNSAPIWSGISSSSTKGGTVYVQGNIFANSPEIPTKISELTDDVGYLKNESDPTVPSWAKANTKPSYTASEVGLGNVDNVKQYSASNPPPYPVTSVNGQDGNVNIAIPSNLSNLNNDLYTTVDMVITYEDNTTETIQVVVPK